MVEFSNLGLLENQSIIKVNISAIQSITDNLPNSGALTDIAQLVNQSVIIGNQSDILQYNATIDSVADAIKVVTDALPDSGALTSLGSIANQSLLLVDGDTSIVNQSTLLLESEHYSYIFPEGSDEVITMHTGAANTFGPWNVVIDSGNNTFSNNFNSTSGHITSMQIEEASVTDKTFIYEVGYGASKTPLLTYRMHSGTTVVGCTQQIRIRSCQNPIGEEIYYRGKCENASANVEASFRYHFH